MESELSKYIDKVSKVHEVVRTWIKDFTLPLEKDNLSEDMKLMLCKNIILRQNEVTRDILKNKGITDSGLNDGENEIIMDMIADLLGLISMLCKYLDMYVIDFNVPECVNQPQYKRDYLYVLVGLVAMHNDNLYVYRVSNYKYKQGIKDNSSEVETYT